MRYIFLILMLVASESVAEDLSNIRWLNCYDGDTCSVDILMPAVLSHDMGVRLSGIDAPEIQGKCSKEKQLALQARDFLVAQMQGATITLRNVFRDKYFRIEAQVYANGVNVNDAMLHHGLAVPYSGSGPRHDWCAAP